MTVSFHYSQTLDILDDLVEDFKLKSKDNADSVNNNNYVENKKTGRLIVMDVSGVADCSNTFGSFLTVITKFSYLAYIYFILFFKERKFEEKLYQKQTFVTFPQSLFHFKPSQRYYRLTCYNHNKSFAV